jgi:hypothetical protein
MMGFDLALVRATYHTERYGDSENSDHREKGYEEVCEDSSEMATKAHALLQDFNKVKLAN